VRVPGALEPPSETQVRTLPCGDPDPQPTVAANAGPGSAVTTVMAVPTSTDSGEGGLGSERGLATPSPDAKGRVPSALSIKIMPQEP